MAILKKLLNIIVGAIIRTALFMIFFFILGPIFFGEGFPTVIERNSEELHRITQSIWIFYIVFLILSFIIYKFNNSKNYLIYNILISFLYFLFIFYILSLFGFDTLSRIPKHFANDTKEVNQYVIFIILPYMEMIIHLVKKTIKYK